MRWLGSGLCFRATRWLGSGLCFRAMRWLGSGLCFRATSGLGSGLCFRATVDTMKLALVFREDARVEEEGAALELGGQARLVGREEHGRAAAPDVLDQVEDLAGHLLVEVARRLVGQKQRGRLHDGPGERGALGLALRELGGVGLGARGQPYRLQGLEGLGRDLVARRAQHAQDESDVLEHGAPGEQLGVLEHDAEGAAEVGDLGAAEGGDVEASDLDVALRGLLVGVEEAQEGGLARAAGPGENDELALLHRERDVVEGRQLHRPALEQLADAVEPYHEAPPFYLSLQTFGSFSIRSLFTTAGLALPEVAFITCPTRKPNAAFFPAS